MEWVQLETLVSKLNIEKRIQYGAEKFLMVRPSHPWPVCHS